jgi:glutathione S-transferase
VLRLITIPISHFCEKARWALDRAGLPYREERHVQGVHQLISRRAGGRGTVPVLVTTDGVFGESEEILDWVDQRTVPEQRLFPVEGDERAEVLALCRRFDDVLGPRGRRLIYVHMLAARGLALQFNNQGVPGWEGGLLRYGWPLAARFVARELDIRPGVEVEDERAVWGEFDFVAGLLSDRGPYLSGDRFGAADLTFAALSASMLAPPQYGVALPQPDVLPPATAELIERAREHPAGRFAMRLFAEHRAQRVDPAQSR